MKITLDLKRDEIRMVKALYKAQQQDNINHDLDRILELTDPIWDKIIIQIGKMKP